MAIQLPNEIYKPFSKDKSPATIQTYTAMLLKLFREVFDTEEFSLRALTGNVKKVEEYLAKQTTVTQKIISIAIVMVLKAAKVNQKIIDEYGIMARKYRIKDTKERIGRKLTDAEKEANVPWSEIVNHRKRYKRYLNNKKETEKLSEYAFQRIWMKYLILALYTYIPPQRGQVFFNCYVDRKVKGSNYVDTKLKKFFIVEHKTKRSFGTREIDIPDPLLRIIKEWMKVTPCNNGLLICNQFGEMMSTQAFTLFMNTVFDRNISTGMLRKIYITEMICNRGINEDEIKELASLLGHSTKSLKNFYVKQDFNE